MPRLDRVPNPRLSHDPELVVFVEGETDVGILQHRWAVRRRGRPLARFGRSPGGGGCTAVIAQVRARRQDPHQAVFGLVDRDVLLHRDHRREDLFLEPDQAVFEANREIEPRILCLSRWEIENFLLADPDVVERTFMDREGRSGPRRARAEVVEELVRLGDTLVPLMAETVLCRLEGRDDPHEDFGHDRATRGEMDAALGGDPDREERRRLMTARLDEHGLDDGSPLEERWDGLCRVIKGKVLLRRLAATRGIARPAWPRTAREICFALASALQTPAEIEQLIDWMEQQVRGLAARSTAGAMPR